MRKIFLTLLVSVVALSSCDDRMKELNQPKKNATEAPGSALFASGLRAMFDMMVSTNVNENVFRLYSQYWAQTTYPDESQYNMVSREIPDIFWRNAYRDALKDLDEAERRIEETADKLLLTEAEKNNQLAIVTTCKVYVYSILVDAFGAAPFTDALNEDNLLPKYDAGEDIYDDIIVMLDGAIASMTEGEPAFPENQDPVYNGDIEGWKKFANSLKLRFAVTIGTLPKNQAKAQEMINQALASGVIESNSDNTALAYLATSPNTNPVWEDLVQSGRADYIIANTITSRLNELNDPRLLVYAAGADFTYPRNKVTKKIRDSVITEYDQMTLLYSDINGEDSIVYVETPFTLLAKDSTKQVKLFVGGDYGYGNAYDNYAHVGDLFHEPDLEGVIFDYAEVNFLLAEAAARGFSVPETIEDYYNEGIRASMTYWGVSEDAVDDYLADPDVAYATADGGWEQKIGIQSWLAFYNRGFEGWSLWRRLDFTGFNVPEDLTYDDIPKRMIFPLEEAQLNSSSLDAAIQLIGADNVQTRVFWDVD